jgi:probable HAF family extracellular repeat protein
VSGDGSVIVGGAFDQATNREAAIRWTTEGGMQFLASPGPAGWAYASDISDDARVIVGYGGTSSSMHHALRWRHGGPPEDLGVLPGAEQSDAFAASADGSIIVGYCIFPGSTQRAFVYTDQGGMVDLTALLLARGVNLQGLTLTVCFNLTPDGSVLVGGTDGSAWRLSVPGWFCYSNCDASSTPPVLNMNDFACFINHFVAGDAYANCDQSTMPPVLNVNDFICCQTRFASGCN